MQPSHRGTTVKSPDPRARPPDSHRCPASRSPELRHVTQPPHSAPWSVMCHWLVVGGCKTEVSSFYEPKQAGAWLGRPDSADEAVTGQRVMGSAGGWRLGVWCEQERQSAGKTASAGCGQKQRTRQRREPG